MSANSAINSEITPTTIEYVFGDATAPQGDGPKVIAHVCNDSGGWGAGFVLALSDRWQAPEAVYRNWHAATLAGTTDYPLELSTVTFVAVEKSLVVANMVAQEGFAQRGRIPLRYGALANCLDTVASYCRGERDGDRHPDTVLPGSPQPSVHMPRIGCGLAGGDWREVEKIIEKTLCAAGIQVTVYDLPNPR